MKPPRHLTITTVGRTDDGLVLNVQLRRRTIGAWRLFYRAARDRSVGRLPAALLAGRICLARGEAGNARTSSAGRPDRRVDELLTERRARCDCAPYRKPCSTCDAYHDGMLAVLDDLEQLEVQQ